MSKIGNKPILVPKNISVCVLKNKLKIKGPLGTLEIGLNNLLHIFILDDMIHVNKRLNSLQSRRAHGTIRQLIFNMINGVTVGFTKYLNIIGIGYKAELKKNTLQLSLGFSHLVDFILPKGINASIDRKRVKIILKSIDKQLLGQVAATIRSFKLPEPYNGKGIFYGKETIKRKEGKSTKK